MNTLTVKADINSLNDVLSFITSELEANDCPAKVQMQIEISKVRLTIVANILC